MLLERINGIIGYYTENKDAVPNVSELINILAECSNVEKDEDTKKAIRDLVDFEVARLGKHGFECDIVLGLIATYKARAIIGSKVDKQTSDFDAALADIYTHYKNDKSKSYDNVEQHLNLLALKQAYIEKNGSLPVYDEAMFGFVSDRYDPMKKARELCDSFKEDKDRFPNRDANIHELLALLFTCKGKIKTDFDVITIIDLVTLEEARLHQMNTVSVCDKLFTVIKLAKDMAFDFRSKSVSPRLAKIIVEISGVYFFIRQQEREMGPNSKYVYDNEDQYNKIIEMFDESGEMSSEIHYNMLWDMVGFIMDRYKESINKGEKRASQPKKVPKNFLNRILGKIKKNDY